MMRPKPLLACALALLAALPAAAAERGVRVRRALLESCPQSQSALSDLNSEAWKPVESALAEHRALRARLGVELPSAPAMILVHAISSHHVTWEASAVAVRGADGRWRIDTVIEESSGLLRMESKAQPRKFETLSAGRSRRLDSLLQDRCLYAEPDLQFRDNSVEAWYSTMDIVTPSHRRTSAWVGGSRGVTGAVADLVIGRAMDD